VRFLWLTSAWSALSHSSDTSLRLVEEAITLGHECLWADFYTLSYVDHRVLVPAMTISSARRPRGSTDFDRSPAALVDISECDIIVVRADPPVDQAYIAHVQILHNWEKQQSTRGSSSSEASIINSPEVLLTLNSKIASTSFLGHRARSVITKDPDVAVRFGTAVGLTVLKPLNASQSIGVSLLKWGTLTERDWSITQFAAATSSYVIPVMLQEYLDPRSEGELRYWCVGGEILAMVRKVATQGDCFVDVDKGDILLPASPNDRDRELGRKISRFLDDNRVTLAAVDTINNVVTDVNVISPGLLCEMEHILETNLAIHVIRHLTGNTC
jgi:glutathione synthase